MQGPTVAMQLQVAEVYKNTNRLETDCIKVRSGDTESKVQKHCHMGRFFLLLLTSSFPTNYKDGDQKLRTKNVSSQVRKRKLASVAHHDGKCDDASHIGIDGSVVDSEYSSPLCNPRISSLRAEACSRAIVDINDSVVDINNLAPPLPTPALAISTPSISPAHEQDQNLRWNSSSPQMPGYLSP